MSEPAPVDALLRAALRPFQALEAQGLAAQYERSFKLEPGRLITQRYMLGVRTDSVSQAQLVGAARSLGMPAAVFDVFEQALSEASAVLFGFEGIETPDAAGEAPDEAPVFKIYTEHRHRLAGPPPAGQPVELFRGFKWQAERPEAAVQTVYTCRTGLGQQPLRALALERLGASRLQPVRAAVGAVLDHVFAAQPGFQAQWLELGEADQPVRAFDLNLYEAGLRVADIAEPLSVLAGHFGIAPRDVARLLDVAGGGLLGHLSAGESRRHAGFLTVYFEPSGGAGAANR